MRIMRFVHRLPMLMAFGALMSLAAPAAQAQTRFIIQGSSPAPSMDILLLAVAEKAGFLKQENITYEYRFSPGGPIAAQLLGSGNADLSHITFEPVAAGYLQGLRGKYIYSTWQRLIYQIGVPVDSPIRTAADLRGKRIGAPSSASAAIITAKQILRHENIPAPDSMFLPVGMAAAAVTAFNSGRIDAYAAFGSAFGGLARYGRNLRFIEHPVAGGIGNGGYFATERAINEKTQAVAGFARAIAKASVFVDANPEAAVRMYWSVFPTTKVGDTEAEAMRMSLAEMKVTLANFDLAPRAGHAYGSFDIDRAQVYFDLLKTEGFINRDVRASEVITNRFVGAANDFDVKAIQELARNWPRAQ